MELTVQRVVDADVAASFYPTYVAAYDALRTRAAARHVLSAAEFAAEMADRRIEKFLVRDRPGGQPIALTTLSDDITAIPWASPDYYLARYGAEAARGALFYLGYTLVDPGHRRGAALLHTVDAINKRVRAVRGVVGFDICGYNQAQGIGRQIARLFGACERIDALDTQSYYAADYRVPVESTPEPAPEPPVRADAESDPVRLVTLAERPELAAQVPALLTSRWPAFLLGHEAGHGGLTSLLQTDPRRQVLLVDGSGSLVAAGLSVPLAWDGTVAGLPSGRDEVLARSSEARTGSGEATCAWSLTVARRATGRGHAARLVRGLRSAAAAVGSGVLVSPVRPLLKARYPLTSIDRYLGWRTPQGESFDPWVRHHVRLGAQVLGAAPRSLTVTASVGDWQQWVDQPFPGSGDFVITDGLAPLRVDQECDSAVYREPGVWVQHPVP